MGKKTIEITTCDKCSNTDKEEELYSCIICKGIYCSEHWVDEDWFIPDTPLCLDCHDKVWKNMVDFIKKCKNTEKSNNSVKLYKEQ